MTHSRFSCAAKITIIDFLKVVGAGLRDWQREKEGEVEKIRTGGRGGRAEEGRGCEGGLGWVGRNENGGKGRGGKSHVW